MLTQNKKSTESENLKSLLVIVVGFLILHIMFKAKVLFNIAVAVGLLSLLSTTASKSILWLWNKIALVLGWINTRIILGMVFYLFLLPIALLFRAFTKNPMQLKNIDESAYTVRNHTYTASDLENTW
jgi:hypothetical protein